MAAPLGEGFSRKPPKVTSRCAFGWHPSWSFTPQSRCLPHHCFEWGGADLQRRRFSTSTSYLSSSSSMKTRDGQEEGTKENEAPSAAATKRLSRPERKALERQRKQQQQRYGSSNKKKNVLSSKDSMGPLTSVEDFMNAIKRAQNSADRRGLEQIGKQVLALCSNHDDTKNQKLSEMEVNGSSESSCSILARLIVAALHLEQHELARTALRVRQEQSRQMERTVPFESAAILRSLVRTNNVTEAIDILNQELSLLPLPDSSLQEEGEEAAEKSESNADSLVEIHGGSLEEEEEEDSAVEPTLSAEKEEQEDAALVENYHRQRLQHRSLSLATLAIRYFHEDCPSEAVSMCRLLAQMGPLLVGGEAAVRPFTAKELDMPWTRLVQGAAQCESRIRSSGGTESAEEMHGLPCNMVYSVLRAMTAFPSENSDATYEALSNALVRRTVFVTGAVSMSGCPPPDRGEAAFIGRSNVGKSSLVNMVTNRKALAYISKTPGKTQQFNFFAVNDKPEREREIRYGDVVPGTADRDTFYLVDLPGFGFAKVPEAQRQLWSNLMTDYVTRRPTLRVLFHLVDARHGAVDEDARIMEFMGRILPRHVTYVVVLTKADKNVRGKATGASSSTNKSRAGKVPVAVMDKLRETMNAAGVGRAPIVLSSAETRLGRDELWKYLRLAAEYQ